VEAALAGHSQYRQLTEQYADLIIEETRQNIAGLKKKGCPPEIRLAQEEEIQRLIASFQTEELQGSAVAQLEVLVRTAVFKSANALVGWLLQQAVDRADAAYQSKPGELRKGRESLAVQGIFGHFQLQRDYYYHAGKQTGHYPADAALGLEGSYTPALAKLICLEGADEPSDTWSRPGGLPFRRGRFNGSCNGWAAMPKLGRSGRPNPAPATPRSCMSAPTALACRWCRRN
jgi:hypothetical protein